MSIRVLRQALETKIKEFAIANGNIPIAYEEIKFDQAGKPIWLKPVLYQGETLNPCIGDNMNRQVGFMQISICIPDGNGMGQVEALADKLIEAFPRGTEILREGAYIQIPRTIYSQMPFSLNTVKYLPMILRYSMDVF